MRDGETERGRFNERRRDGERDGRFNDATIWMRCSRFQKINQDKEQINEKAKG